jgi:hypothetical protein
MSDHKNNEQAELELALLRLRQLVRQISNGAITQRVSALIIDLEQRLREIDE